MGAGPNGEKLVVPTLRDFLIRQCAGISRHAKMLSQGLLSSSLLVKGVAEAALYCAHRTSTFLSCAFGEQEGHLATPSLSSVPHPAGQPDYPDYTYGVYG